MNMSNVLLEQDPQAECKFVEVLTSETSGEIIGHRFAGSQSGPNALIAGDADLIASIYNRLIGMPTLPWVRGSVYLVEIDGIELFDMRDVKSCLSDVVFDEIILLPNGQTEPVRQHAVHRAYWALLRLCRQLGMSR
jgi:hypothetical protein